MSIKDTSIKDMTARDLGSQISSGKLNAQDVTSYFIDRIKAHNPDLNAVIANRFEAALEDSKAADEARARGDIKGPLHGVPMTIKDAFEVEGLSCDVGAPQFANYISWQDSTVTRRLKAAGAIILGKTNTPLFCGDWQSFNALHGTTNNPYNIAHTPGGSSGGAAAALAAGLTPLEYGSDIGGSIRVPAHYCGLFGHKPTLDIVPTRGHVPPPHGALATGDLSVVGPLGKSMDDVALAFNLTVGLEGSATQALQLSLQGPRTQEPAGLRIGVWASDPYCEVDNEIAAGIEGAARKLEKDGAHVSQIKPDFDLAHHTEVYMMMLNPIMGTAFPPEVHEAMQTMVDSADPDGKSFAMMQARGIRILHKDWLIWNEMRAQIAAKWQALFEQIDVLFCPVTPTPAMPHDHNPDFAARKIEVNGIERAYMENIVWPGVATLCGLPATTVPLGRHSSNLPFGMQIVGPAYEDNTPIAVGHMLERAGYRFQAPQGY